MKVLVIDNAHLYKTPDGKYYTPSIYNHEFFQRYLNVFDEVRFVSKTKYVESIDTSKYLLVSCEGLEIYELPWYQGLKGMLKQIFKLIARYRGAAESCDCYIFRVAQIESYFTFMFAKRKNKPYAVEVVNDPTSFTDLKGILKLIYIRMLKYMINKANGVSYVTQSYLQGKYPNKLKNRGNGHHYFESSYSSIELSESYINVPKQYRDTLSSFEIIHVANAIVGESKGHRTLIEVVQILNEQGYNITACCIGDGDSIQEFEQYAEKLGVKESIKFIGRLHSKNDVMERLSKSDLFLFPSHYEGLPRCVIEAQAAGLPCLSTPVGGIPELLPAKYLFQPDDSQGFARKLIALINNPQELNEMSHQNIETAKSYTKDKLTLKRNAFYKKLRNLAVNN